MKKIYISDNVASVCIYIALIIFLCVGSCNEAKAQYFGENWTSVPANLTPEIRGYINEKIPVGGVYIGCFRNDKYAEKGNGIAPQVEINNVIALADLLKTNGKELKLIYTFDTRGRVSPENAFVAFDQFIGAGIDIPAVRGGNEEFAKVAGHDNFTAYTSYLTPLESELSERGFTGYFFIPLDRYDNIPDGKGKGEWNKDAAAYCALKPSRAGDIHMYWNERNCPSMSRLQVDANGERYLPTAVSNGAYLSFQDDFYRDSYIEVTTSTFIDDVMSWYNLNFPNKVASITEFGPLAGVGTLQGSLSYAAAEDWFYNQIKNRKDVFAVCKFNGAGTPTGSITKAGKFDTNTGWTKRLSHYTQELFLRNQNATPFQFTGEGQFNFSVHNLNSETLNLTLPEGYYFESFSYECIKGQYFYSSAGTMSWWANGSTKTYEIYGTKTFDYIPAMSYGYVTCTIKKIPVYGCSDPLANNYDATATQDDGSCVYDVMGCMSRDASNFNEAATIDDGSCIFPPKECLKKRWLFTSMPCKKSKNNVCDCE